MVERPEWNSGRSAKFYIWGISSVGRVLAWHARGQRFEPAILHNMFSVYIIYSNKIDQYYIGQTENIENRLYRHNNSGSKSTKKANDWVLMYTEEFPTRVLAVKREAEIKKKKSRVYLESLIRS